MKRVQQGFTLIELMIVVAIIGILAAVAIPQYQNYIMRAKVANAVTVAESVKTALGEFYQSNGSWSSGFGTAVGQLGIVTPTSKEVSLTAFSTTTGAITLTLQGIKATTVDGLTIVFTPDVSVTGAANMKWVATTTATEPAVVQFVAKVSGS